MCCSPDWLLRRLNEWFVMQYMTQVFGPLRFLHVLSCCSIFLYSLKAIKYCCIHWWHSGLNWQQLVDPRLSLSSETFELILGLWLSQPGTWSRESSFWGSFNGWLRTLWVGVLCLSLRRILSHGPQRLWSSARLTTELWSTSLTKALYSSARLDK